MDASVTYNLIGRMLPSNPDSYDTFLIVSGLLGIAVGIGWSFMLSRVERRCSPLIVAGVAAVLGALTVACGLRQFGGFDHSVAVDVAWRMINGQTPYVDFPCTLPPGFYLGAFYAFMIFGPLFQSLVFIQAAFVVVTFLWCYWLLKTLLHDEPSALIFSVALSASSVVLVGYWWYNPITSMTAVIYLLSCALFLNRSSSWMGRLSLLASLFALAFMKPNIAGLLIVLATLVLLSSREHRVITVLLSAIGGAAFTGVFAAHRLSIPAMIQGYRGIAGRGFASRLFQDASDNERIFVCVTLVLLLVPFGSSAARALLRKRDRISLLAIAGLAVGIYGLMTNGEVKLVDSSLVLASGWLYVLVATGAAGGIGRDAWRRYCGFVALLLAFVGTGEAIVRHRVKAIGYRAFFEYAMLNDAMPSGFFLNCRIGPRLAATDGQVAAVLAGVSRAEHKPQNSLRVYFGPRMQWAYAAYGLQSPAGLPVWWHPGVSFKISDEERYVRHLRESRFDVAIFLKGDSTYLSPEAIDAVTRGYVRDERLSELSVFLPGRLFTVK